VWLIITCELLIEMMYDIQLALGACSCVTSLWHFVVLVVGPTFHDKYINNITFWCLNHGLLWPLWNYGSIVLLLPILQCDLLHVIGQRKFVCAH